MVKCCRLAHCGKLRCEDFDLTHEEPSLFVKSQIPVTWGHWVAVVWNSVWFVFFTVILYLDIFYYTTENRHLWLIFLSNWAYLLTVCTTLAEVIVRMYVVKCGTTTGKEESQDMVWCQKVLWVLYNTNNIVTILSTIIYSSLSEVDMSLPSISKHFLPCVYVILNTSVITSLPVKIFHFYQSAIFLIIYAIFISIYQHVSPQPGVFLVFDWDKQERSAILLSSAVIIGCPLIQFLFYCVFLLRRFVFKRCSNQKSTVTLPSSMQRDITATDVILEDSGGPYFIDIKPDVKDDIAVKPAECANGDVFKRYNGRLYKSETDLRDYRLKNGLYCEFAKSSLKFHTCSSFRTTSETFGDVEPHLDNSFTNRTSERRGSQIIVVKKCKTPQNEDESDTSSSDCDSDASSDYLSQYITEDILAYL